MTAADNALLKRDSRRLGWLMLLYILLFQLGTMVMVFVTALLLSRIGFTLQDSSVLLIASDLTQALVGMLFLRLYLREREQIHRALVRNVCGLRLLLLSLAGVVAWNTVITALDWICQTAFGLSLSGDAEIPQCSLLMMLLLLAVFPAVAEELIFRGVIYRFLRRYGAFPAAVTSSLLFGLMHLNVIQTVFAFGMGLILCRLYEKTGRLRWCMLIHLINNGISVLLMQPFAQKPAWTAAQVVTGLIALPVIAVLLIRRKPAPEPEMRARCGQLLKTVPMLLLFAGCIVFSVMLVKL